jgi:hypothetical protein
MNRMQIRLWSPWVLGPGVLLAGVSLGWAQTQSDPVVVKAAKRAFSPPLSQMAPLPPGSNGLDSVPDEDRMQLRRPSATGAVEDAALQGSPTVAPASLTPLSTNSGLNILGVGIGIVPGYTNQANVPDTNGAVGPTQFVQFVNDSFAVFNKADGSVAYGPANGNTLWNLLGAPCSSTTHLDEIAQFDKLANRWVMMMPVGTASPPVLCIAVSKTSDAVTGGWNLYAFQVPLTSSCNCRYGPDYPKLAVWPDAYYLSYNQDGSGTFEGAAACALDRNSMLAGSAATMQCFTNIATSYGALLPADLDGIVPPPTGSSEYFLSFDGNDQSLDLWQFQVDWTTSNPTFSGPTKIPVTAFTEPCGETVVEITYTTGDCIPQLGTSQGLDSYGDRLMYRLAYRNLGSHQSLLANHTVLTGASGTPTGIRWYELQDTGLGFSVYQQGTYAPDSSYRWMGSIAMDQSGDIALGYSVSDSTMSPTIRYTGRLPSDSLGTMESETDVLTAAGVTHGSATVTFFHWADYSSMAIDPTDDCTFWYTTEYVPTTGGNWATRIASFSFPTCSGPTLTVSLTGSGSVTSTPSGINCSSSQCSSTFVSGTSVTLSAAATAGSSFTGWTGACTGTAPCTLRMTSAQSVGATFAAPDFTVTPSPTTQTVSPGGVASYTLAIAGLGGFNSPVTLACTAPSAQEVNCSLASTSATPGTSVSLTVTTTAPSAARNLSPGTVRSSPLYASWLGFPALALVGIGSLGLRSKNRRLSSLLLCSILLCSVALQTACGASGNSTTAPKNPGTPAGTYTVNINATAGATQHRSSVSVTVQ